MTIFSDFQKLKDYLLYTPSDVFFQKIEGENQKRGRNGI